MQIWTVGDIQMIEVDEVVSIDSLAKGHIARTMIIG